MGSHLDINTSKDLISIITSDGQLLNVEMEPLLPDWNKQHWFQSRGGLNAPLWGCAQVAMEHWCLPSASVWLDLNYNCKSSVVNANVGNYLGFKKSIGSLYKQFFNKNSCSDSALGRIIRLSDVITNSWYSNGRFRIIISLAILLTVCTNIEAVKKT